MKQGTSNFLGPLLMHSVCSRVHAHTHTNSSPRDMRKTEVPASPAWHAQYRGQQGPVLATVWSPRRRSQDKNDACQTTLDPVVLHPGFT